MSSIWVVLLYLSHPFSLLSFESSSGFATLPSSQGGVVRIFVLCGHQGAEEDAKKSRLKDRLLQAVLVEAQMVCVLVNPCFLLVI